MLLKHSAVISNPILSGRKYTPTVTIEIKQMHTHEKIENSRDISI